eukprot:12436862-Ditylum_brightwellii.AAC.1
MNKSISEEIKKSIASSKIGVIIAGALSTIIRRRFVRKEAERKDADGAESLADGGKEEEKGNQTKKANFQEKKIGNWK